MKNTIISSVVAIVCVVALCVTYAVVGKGGKNADNTAVAQNNTADIVAAAANDDYMTEAEAAAYIGVSTEIMQMMRENLGFFKGAYMNYMYLDAEGKEVNSVVYNKEALNDEVAKISKEKGALSFKFLQEQK